MTLAKFDYYIGELRDAWEFGEELNAMWRRYDPDAFVWPPIPSDAFIDLLEYAFGDDTQLISYWIYDLDFGKHYEDGCITGKDGRIIRLKTVEDLYNELTRREEGENCQSTESQS